MAYLNQITLNGQTYDIADPYIRGLLSHNIPRLTPKDITSYYTDGSLWNRIAGSNGYSLFDDIFVGDYFKMSRPVSAKNPSGTNQATGSQWVTIADIDGRMGDGDSSPISYHHLIMVPGQGFDGTQHFGRSYMNASNTTVGGYQGTVMHNTVLGAVTSSGSTSDDATVNQQLYAEFGSHLKTTRELLSNGINASGYNRFGANSGCSNNWSWASCQAVLMSEAEVYGTTVWSSSGFDTGNAYRQLSLFAYSKKAINNRSAYYWLKDVASASRFAYSYASGLADYSNAGYSDLCVRPRFVIA